MSVPVFISLVSAVRYVNLVCYYPLYPSAYPIRLLSSFSKICWLCLYTVFQKKLHPFYFCNNFVDPGPIWINFGRYVANEFSSGLQGLGYHAGLSVSDTDT